MNEIENMNKGSRIKKIFDAIQGLLALILPVLSAGGGVFFSKKIAIEIGLCHNDLMQFFCGEVCFLATTFIVFVVSRIIFFFQNRHSVRQ